MPVDEVALVAGFQSWNLPLLVSTRNMPAPYAEASMIAASDWFCQVL